MKNILQLEANDGSNIFVEISNEVQSEPMRGSITQNRGVIENVKEGFDQALYPLQQVSNSIINCIREISNSPKEVEVELGFKFTAKAGIILTSLDSEAHFRITLKWTNDK
ncbi:CU044_2847 family protein [Mucilaginibacter arboris]|uniref:Trypsin-co-occurring domain-containing protein n=1 Tax=Mucilaginibacter arboris TaxID=2682090 RepID=A0A7K1SYC6_9SPHI|nr:CU044_2847 family protein [Mucilaginibacter arboris]MVN22257.1 hypothetical protein [Mucilaginibacter arboris]